MSDVFRPRMDVWFGRVALPAAFVLVLAVTALNLVGVSPALGWLVLALLPTIGVLAGIYALPVLLGRIAVDRYGILLALDGMRLGVPWKDVRAVQIVTEGGDPYLMLGVRSGLYVLPVHHFHPQALWAAIQRAAPAEAVKPEAIAPYERKDAGEGIPPSLWMVGVLRVSDRPGLLTAGGFGAAGFFVLFLIVVLTRQPGALLYLVFSMLYVLLLTGVGMTEFDMEGVTRRTLLGVTRILWDELSAVEFGPFGLRVVLEGMRERRLVLFGPPLWNGLDASRAAHFLALQISTRRLPRRRSLAVLFKVSRNTRVEGA